MLISEALYEKLQTINSMYGAAATVQFLFALNEYYFNNIKTTDKVMIALGIEDFYITPQRLTKTCTTDEQLLSLLYEGKTIKEIIQETGLPRSTAYRRINKVKEMLKLDNTNGSIN